METFRGRKIVIPKTKNWKVIDITDKYSLTQRLSCRVEDGPRPIDVWKEHPEWTLQDLQKHVRVCTLYPFDIGMQVLKMFKPKKWLDPTAGWGDRLRCAIEYGCEYLGVDTNSSMQSAYKAIVDDLAEGDHKKYRVKEGKFQNVRIVGKYDLIFTSPPFYTFEKYDNMADWKSIEEFMSDFLIPLFKRSVAHLETNGNIVLYIEDRPNSPFIDLMKEHVKDAHPELKYEGAFYYEGWRKGKFRPYYVWKLL